MKTAVSYLRVSTKHQGVSGLGIDAQRAAVEAYCKQNGLALIKEYREIESGRNNERPVLHDAIARALATRSVLVIARLDRLSRSVRFIAELLEGDLKFVACDVPSANRVVFGILAVVAEEEARATSIRIKAAMAAAKARGRIFGTPGNLPANAAHLGARASVVARRKKRDALLAGDAGKRIRELRMQGGSYRQIALALNDEQFKTSRGSRWQAKEVWAALRRLRMGNVEEILTKTREA